MKKYGVGVAGELFEYRTINRVLDATFSVDRTIVYKEIDIDELVTKTEDVCQELLTYDENLARAAQSTSIRKRKRERMCAELLELLNKK